MRRAVLSVVVAVGLGLPARPSLAAPEPAPAPTDAGSRASALQAMHAEAQQRVERYNATHDASHLAAARELLARWLVEHRALYGDAAEAATVRAPIEQQLGAIDAELVRVGAPVAPTAAVAPVPAPAPRPAISPEHVAALRRARAMVGSGIAMTVAGGVTLMTVSLPLWVLRNRALRRANEQTFYVDERRLVARARRRHAGAVTTCAVGTVLAAAGVTLLAVGGVKQARLRRELTLAPELGPGFAGASAVLRF